MRIFLDIIKRRRLSMKTILAVLLSLTMASCSLIQKQDKKVDIATNLKAGQYQNIYFSGQPKLENFSELKENGFTTIINLRTKKEYAENEERAQVKSLGMNYYQIGIKKAPLTDKFIDKVTAAVVKHRKKGKVLIHCSSGNRAGLWAGGHFYKDHGYSKEKSVKIGKELGITKEKIEKKLRKYLNQ